MVETDDGDAQSLGRTLGPTPERANHVFVVSGLASPQLLLRVLGLFAQQELLPVTLNSRRAPTGIVLRIEQDAIDDHRACVILEKMRAMVEVEAASLVG